MQLLNHSLFVHVRTGVQMAGAVTLRYGLMLLILSVAAFTPAKVHGQTLVTGITLMGPETIPCPGQATYTFTVTGTYTPNAQGDPNDPDNFVVSVFDDDGAFNTDDPLASPDSFLFPSAVTLNSTNNTWTYTDTFILSCIGTPPDCEV